MEKPRNQYGNRMTLANVSRGKQIRPIRAIIYGVEGAGKSTFAADAPSPIFICAEDGTSHLDVARFPSPKSFQDVLDACATLLREDHDFKTIVIDTLDWLEPIVWAHTCAQHGKSNIEEFAYGKGFLYAADSWRMLIERLDLLSQTKKMHVILVAHSSLRKQDDLHAGAFDRYKMKLHERTAELFREWVDCVLFARYDVKTVKEGTGKIKRSRGVYSGERVIHTQWSAAFDAKNRYGLPEKMPLSWPEFYSLVYDDSQVDSLILQIKEEIAKIPDDKKEEASKALYEWAKRDKTRLSRLYERVVFIAGSNEAQNAEPEQ